MEAGRTSPPPPPPGAAPPPPPPPAGAPVGRPADDRAGTGPRILAVIVALVFLLAGAVMIVVSVDLAQGPRCEQVVSGEEPPDEDGECLNDSKSVQEMTVVLTFLSGIAAGLTVVAGILFAIRGRGWRLIAITAAAAIVLGGVGLLIG